MTSLDHIRILQIAFQPQKMRTVIILGVTYTIFGLLIICLPTYFSLGLLLIPLLVVTVIMNPVLGLVGYVLGLSLTQFTLFQIDIPFSPGADTVNIHQFFLVLTFFGWSVNLLVKREERLKSSFIYLPTSVLIGYALLTIVWAPDLRVSLLTFAKISANILSLFLIIQLVDTEKKQKVVLGAFVLTGIIGALSVIFTTKALLGGAVGLALGEKETIIRVYGLMENTEGLAGLLTQSLFVALGVVYSLKSTGKRIFLLCMCILMFFCIIVTFSRGWLIGCFAGVLFLALRKRNVRAFVLLSGLVLIFFVVLQLSGGILEKFSHRFVLDVWNLPAEDPRAGRLLLYAGAWQLFLQSYGLGVGLSGFPLYIGHLFPAKAGMYPHSLYLTILVELGVVGSMIFVWWVFILVNHIMRALRVSQESYYQNIFLGWCGGAIAVGLNGFIRLSLAHNWWAYVALGIVIMSVGLRMDKFNTGRREKDRARSWLGARKGVGHG
jgi:hypothetical protein